MVYERHSCLRFVVILFFLPSLFLVCVCFSFCVCYSCGTITITVHTVACIRASGMLVSLGGSALAENFVVMGAQLLVFSSKDPIFSDIVVTHTKKDLPLPRPLLQ